MANSVIDLVHVQVLDVRGQNAIEQLGFGGEVRRELD